MKVNRYANRQFILHEILCNIDSHFARARARKFKRRHIKSNDVGASFFPPTTMPRPPAPRPHIAIAANRRPRRRPSPPAGTAASTGHQGPLLHPETPDTCSTGHHTRSRRWDIPGAATNGRGGATQGEHAPAPCSTDRMAPRPPSNVIRVLLALTQSPEPPRHPTSSPSNTCVDPITPCLLPRAPSIAQYPPTTAPPLHLPSARNRPPRHCVRMAPRPCAALPPRAPLATA